MALTITLPTSDLLGLAGAFDNVLSTAATTAALTNTLRTNSINVVSAARSTAGTPPAYDYILTLPTATTGEVVYIKRTGTALVQVASATIEGTAQTLEITNNQPVVLVYVNDTFGWLIT